MTDITWAMTEPINCCEWGSSWRCWWYRLIFTGRKIMRCLVEIPHRGLNKMVALKMANHSVWWKIVRRLAIYIWSHLSKLQVILYKGLHKIAAQKINTPTTVLLAYWWALLPQLSESEALALEQGFEISLSNSLYIPMYPWAHTVIYLYVQRYTVKSLSSSALHLAACPKCLPVYTACHAFITGSHYILGLIRLVKSPAF